MAVYTYGNNDIQFSTFDVWSNAGFTDDTNITLNDVGLSIYPAPSLGSFSVDDLRNTSFLHGTITSTGNGTWGCQYPGVGRDDCLFATDCQWCGGGGGGWWW